MARQQLLYAKASMRQSFNICIAKVNPPRIACERKHQTLTVLARLGPAIHVICGG
jgi:hypothetical protein